MRYASSVVRSWMLRMASSSWGRFVTWPLLRAGYKPAPRRSPPGRGRVLLVAAHLVMQRVAVDAEALGGVDVDPVAQDEHLLDQLALHALHHAVVQVALLGRHALDGRLHQLLDQPLHVAGPARAAHAGPGQLA